MVVGLGSGSTATHFIRLLGERVKSGGLKVRGIASSRASEELAVSLAIPIVKLGSRDRCGYRWG